MEGRTNWNDSFPDTFDSHQGSPNDYVDRLNSLVNGLSPVESRLSNHMLSLHDGSMRCTSTPSNHAQTSRGWDRGESSSTGKNVQEQTVDDDSKMKFAWYSPSGTSSVADTGPEDTPPGPSTTISPSYVGNQVTNTSYPPTFRPNHRHLRENSNYHSGLGGGQPHTLHEPGCVGTEEIMARYASSSNLGTPSCSSSTCMDNDASGPSLGTWGSSCKRKALEGSSRHFHTGGSSNSSQLMDNVVQHPHITASRNLTTSLSSSSADRSEQLNLRNGVGTGRVCSGRFASSSAQGVNQNPARNFTFREPVQLDPSRGLSVGHSSLYALQPQPQPIPSSDALELMSPMTLPLNLNSTLNEPFVDVNEVGHTHRHPLSESLSSRRGSSSSSLLTSGERGYGAREANFRSSFRNIPEYPAIVPPSDTMNIFGDQIDWSFTPGTSASSRNYSGARLSSAAWLPHGSQTSQDPRRSLESVPWIPFPSIESDSGTQRSPFPPLHLAPASSGDRVTPSHTRHQSGRRPSSILMDARGDNSNGRNVLAAVEERHRLIRHVLSAMRRGAPLRDEDYMLIDPFVNGFAELHDQNMDMRLDVDNMSYEELLALEEQIGNVSTGLSEEKIRSSMKKRKCGAFKALQAMEPCCICQEDYVAGDDIGILDCGHEFHTSCIKQWLILKNICPICKNTALGT